MPRPGLQFLSFAAALLAAAVAAAADEPVVPPEKLVYCTVCHGVQLKGNHVIQAPRLSGLPDWYVERQLLGFKRGWRGVDSLDLHGMEMRPMAALLTDPEIREATRYVAATASERPAVTIEGDADRGRTVYTTCAACHGADGSGNEALGSPPLTGLNDWYLVRQLENFKAGIRGDAPADTYGAQMRAASQVLADDQAILDVVSYINTLEHR